MDSLFKVGDKVRILKEYLPGTDSEDYPFRFIDDMIDNFGGKFVTIDDVIDVSYDNNLNDYSCFNGDLYEYFIIEDRGKYSWHSSMFERGNVQSNTINIF